MAELGVGQRLHVHVASAGNEFMTHIADLLAWGFRSHGTECEVVVDGLPLDERRSGALSIVIAPHEFFPLHFLRTRPTIELAPTLASVAVLNVEQPGSQWFDVASEYARQARHVFDISPAGVAEFQRRGLTARHAPLGYAPVLQAADIRPMAERSIDVLFFGHTSPRRRVFLARYADYFSGINAHLLLSGVNRPRSAATPGYQSGSDRLNLIASSRIVLCVHSTDRPYFEQHRAMLALANGSLLVTETSTHTEPLEDGTHFASAALDQLPDVCRRYLAEAPALERVAAAGREMAATRMPIGATCALMLDTLRQPAASLARVGNDDARDAVRGRLAESARRRALGDTPWTTMGNAAYDVESPPAISVLVTLFNYRQYVARCLESVPAATAPKGGLEIVVVDDGSTDGGPDVVHQLLAASTTPGLLVRKSINTGLADARNVGLSLARGRQVFVLDADNWIYPSCLLVLQEALDHGGAVAAYGHIARIDEQTGEAIDLMSSMDWSPLRLVEGPYIDAMALLDRQAVLDVGGYSTELIDHGWFGWEDYDLWLKLAQAGQSCRHVPRIVAGYRDHASSMLRRTNRSSRQLADYFATKFAMLLRQYPDVQTQFTFPRRDASLTPEQAEIERLRDQLVRLERQLADVYASKSWTVTAPLRAALKWLETKHGRQPRGHEGTKNGVS